MAGFRLATLCHSSKIPDILSYPFYTERLLCYECHHALGALRFFAKSDNYEGYQLARAFIQRKLV